MMYWSVCLPPLFNFPGGSLIPVNDVVSPSSESIFSSTILACGIHESTQTGITEFNSTWITPAGERIATAGSYLSVMQGRYNIQNIPEIPPYQYLTALSINRLSYVDSGIYDCSASYVADGIMITESNSVELNLIGRYI